MTYILQHYSKQQVIIPNLMHLLQRSIAILQTFDNLHFNLCKLQVMYLQQNHRRY